MELESAARRVDEIGGELADVAKRLGTMHPPATGFGADGSGALGELGRAFAGQASGAIIARAAEAGALGDAASGLAVTVLRATTGYREVDGRQTNPSRAGGA